jgi:hypothetical protein
MSWYEKDFSWVNRHMRHEIRMLLEHPGVTPESHLLAGDFLSGDLSGSRILQEMGFSASQIIGFDLEPPINPLVDGVVVHQVDLNDLAHQIRKGNELPEPIQSLRGQLDVLLFLVNPGYVDIHNVQTLKEFFGSERAVLLDL